MIESNSIKVVNSIVATMYMLLTFGIIDTHEFVMFNDMEFYVRYYRGT